MKLKDKAFTLIEILLVVAAIAVLAGIVILAINPTHQLAKARNSQRYVDVDTIQSALYQNSIDSSLSPVSVSSTALEICRTGASSCAGLADLSLLTNNSKYLISLPIDPHSTSTNGTGYMVCKNLNGRTTVYSPLAELGTAIQNGPTCENIALSFSCGGTLIDSRDGESYPTVQIGTQCWTAKNAAYLPSVSPSATGGTSTPYYYVYGYQGADTAAAKLHANYGSYGVLYNFLASLTACPPGWHLSSDAEWTVLTNFTGGALSAGGTLKSSPTDIIPWDGSNNFNFKILPTGRRHIVGSFFSQGVNGYFWTSLSSPSGAWARGFTTGSSSFTRSVNAADYGYPARCLQN
ncbi:MAG: FISUMP domain-containing protein [Candidatus Falkowbacteria bacterium]